MAAATRVRKTELEVRIGKDGLQLGRLVHAKDGRREYSSFSFDARWLASPTRFSVSPDLALATGPQHRKASTHADACVFGALADTAPQGWGRRVIARTNAAARELAPALALPSELDVLCAVDDFARVGALRLAPPGGAPLRSVEQGLRAAPRLAALAELAAASRAVEQGSATSAELIRLQGAGTSLGGSRPKVSLLDEDGALVIAKLAALDDPRSVPRGEVLALRLARRAGIDAAEARVQLLADGAPVALIRRFDRTAQHRRIPYLSAASMLQARPGEDHAYTELVDAIDAHCAQPRADAQELWRRLVFNLLIGNSDDHLHNHGFMYAGQGLWRLAPAFDLNPLPERPRGSITWLAEDTGPITSINALLAAAGRFHLDAETARRALAEVLAALGAWRELALGAEIGMSPAETDAFAPAFEHAERDSAQMLLG